MALTHLSLVANSEQIGRADELHIGEESVSWLRPLLLVLYTFCSASGYAISPGFLLP